MGISLEPRHLKRYQEIARLLWKHGHRDFLSEAGLDQALTEEERRESSPEAEAAAEELADDLEAMGPIFIKIGQVLASRSDFLPPPYLNALTRLQDSLAPFPFEQVQEIVRTELGVRLSRVFPEFDPEPIAAASLGQVHRATLRDGRRVAVKVQRPGIRDQIAQDLDILEGLAELADRHSEAGKRLHFSELLENFARNLARELDYRMEAGHLAQIAGNLREFRRITVPRPVDDFTTTRVLTMEWVSGRKVTALSPLARMEIDGPALAQELLRAYLKQVLVDGFFHADPHAGNVFVTDDGRLALIDLGMVGRVSPELQEKLLRYLLAIGSRRSDEAADVLLEIGRKREGFDEGEFRRRVTELIADQRDASVSRMQTGKVTMELCRAAAESGMSLPPELALLGKTLLSLDEIARTLDPEFNPNESIHQYSGEVLRQWMAKSVESGNLLVAALDAREFATELPRRVNRILDTVARNELRVGVKVVDMEAVVDVLQRVANRLSTGLVLASLIVGASLLMRVETRFQLFGYPGLAILLFLAAAAGGFWLVISILMSDRAAKQKQKE